MKPRFAGAHRGVAWALASLLVLAACDNKPSGLPPAPGAPIPEQSPVPAPPPPLLVPAPAAPAPAPAAAAPSTVPLGTQQAVYAVDSLVVSRPDDAPKTVVIKANGSVRTGGWSDPKLEEMPDSDDHSVKSYRFVATSPTASATIQALQGVEAELRVDTLPPKVKTIRVVSETNEISASVEQ